MDPSQHPPRSTSLANQRDGAGSTATSSQRPSHFQHDGYGGESWMDFLRRDTGDEHTPSHSTSSQPAYASSDRHHSQSSSAHTSSHGHQHHHQHHHNHHHQHYQHHNHYNLDNHHHQPLTLPDRPLPLPRPDLSSSHSTDRKRRLTTAESPMRRPSSIRIHGAAAANTSSDPVLVPDESPPLPRLPPSSSAMSRPLPPPPPQSSPPSYRRESDLVLPSWQPDADVSQCPVCSRPFTFLFRKHHCRKCGRVVCSSCSPHRITIPRQFIVHPPSDITANFIDLTGDDDANIMSSFGPFRNPALGGGEEVRVCNPCVPDPNFNPPPQYNSPGPPRNLSYTASIRPGLPPPSHPSRTRTHRSSSNVHDGSQSVGPGQTHYSRDGPGDRRGSYHSGALTGIRWQPPRSNSNHIPPSHSQQYDHTGSSSSRPNHGTTPNFGLGSGSLTRANMFPRPLFTSTTSTPTPPRPRRQIAEEDECPICGDELPPISSSGDESARTQHIESCIALHSASPAPVSTMSLPTQRTRGMSNPAGHSNAAEGSNRAIAARGMFPYVATEKDCTNNDGNEIECIICLEDFEAGDRMARLVCWCKFHEKCIKDWWEKKGRGACPTHQLQE